MSDTTQNPFAHLSKFDLERKIRSTEIRLNLRKASVETAETKLVKLREALTAATTFVPTPGQLFMVGGATYYCNVSFGREGVVGLLVGDNLPPRDGFVAKYPPVGVRFETATTKFKKV